jgi:hypothetical protein
MEIIELQKAILSKDPNGVVAAVRDWDETQRAAAVEPLDIFALALGFEIGISKTSKFNLASPEVLTKRAADGITPMSHRDRNYDRDMYWIAWLARYAIADVTEFQQIHGCPNHIERSAQIMADRNPSWWRQWVESASSHDEAFEPKFWALLYQLKMVTREDFVYVKSAFRSKLPEIMTESPDAVQVVLHEVPECRELLYDVPAIANSLFPAKAWIPIVQWLQSNDYLDQQRLLQNCIAALDDKTNQTERNGCLMLMKAVKPNTDVFAMFQSDWLRFVSDPQATVAGYAVGELQRLQKTKRLDRAAAIATLPNLFRNPTKSHALSAVKLLSKLAEDASYRHDAVIAILGGLLYPDKHVQTAVIETLQSQLRATDSEAIDYITNCLDSVMPTLRGQAAMLLKMQAEQTTVDEAENASDSNAVPMSAVSAIFVQADLFCEETRIRFRINEAISMAQRGRIDEQCGWRMIDVCVLEGIEPIAEITSVEELVDVTSAAVERCESSDTLDRILSGIARLSGQQSESFHALTTPLAKRACTDVFNRPNRGIVGGYFGQPFSLLIGAWLEQEPNDADYQSKGDPIATFIVEVAQRVRSGSAYPLLSAATHRGGWIDPRIWIERCREIATTQTDFLESDLVRSLLRLAPDHRLAALQTACDLPERWHRLAEVALGNKSQEITSMKLDDSWSLQVWITALRVRDPETNLATFISERELAVFSPELMKAPDVVHPSDYQWTAQSPHGLASLFGLVDSVPTQHIRELQAAMKAKTEKFEAQLAGTIPKDSDFDEHLESLKTPRDSSKDTLTFFTAQLHFALAYPAPPFTYPYFASQWPMKLDWYWSLATKALSQRVESGASVDEPYSQFLLPLFEIDRPLTRMAARALWIASVSKDTTARSMAIEVWIAMAGEDRIDVGIVGDAFADVAAGGWVKINRVAEVLAEVASISPLHAWMVASVLETLLVRELIPSKDVAKILEPLDECCETLGRSITPELVPSLTKIKSGKAKVCAKSLLTRADVITPDRQNAIETAVTARIARAHRHVFTASP